MRSASKVKGFYPNCEECKAHEEDDDKEEDIIFHITDILSHMLYSVDIIIIIISFYNTWEYPPDFNSYINDVSLCFLPKMDFII